MTEFITYMLIPADTRDVAGRVYEIMAHYHGDTEVEPYETPCFCLLSQAVQAFQDAEAAGEARSQEVFDDALGKAPPDPVCRWCNGKGCIMTTHNPAARWRRWEPGKLENETLESALVDPTTKPLHNDCVPLRLLEIDRLPLPFAVVTPDGAIHARGEMLYSGKIPREDPEWSTRFQQLLADHPDTLLVVAKCEWW